MWHETEKPCRMGGSRDGFRSVDLKFSRLNDDRL